MSHCIAGAIHDRLMDVLRHRLMRLAAVCEPLPSSSLSLAILFAILFNLPQSLLLCVHRWFEIEGCCCSKVCSVLTISTINVESINKPAAWEKDCVIQLMSTPGIPAPEGGNHTSQPSSLLNLHFPWYTLAGNKWLTSDTSKHTSDWAMSRFRGQTYGCRLRGRWQNETARLYPPGIARLVPRSKSRGSSVWSLQTYHPQRSHESRYLSHLGSQIIAVYFQTLAGSEV